MWFRGFMKPTVLKFGENIELACEKVSFSADYSPTSGKLDLSNNGDVAISGMKIKISKAGEYTTEDINNVATETWNGLSKGRAFTSALNIDTGATEILVIPVLRGTSEEGEQDYVCDERFGVIAYSE